MSAPSLKDLPEHAQGAYLLTLFRKDMQVRLEHLITEDLLERARPMIKTMVSQAVASLEPSIRAMAEDYGRQLVVNVSVRDPDPEKKP